MANTRPVVVVKGGGDLGTGVAYRLFMCGFRVAVLEQPAPTAIRRCVAFASAVDEGRIVVEGVEARRVESVAEMRRALRHRRWVPVLVVEERAAKRPPLRRQRRTNVRTTRPDVLVDATLVKQRRLITTSRRDARLTIALGPGFVAGRDVDAVIETSRGHDLGRVIRHGRASPDTGTPGDIAGRGSERVLRATATGLLHGVRKIGARVRRGDVVAWIVRERRAGASPAPTNNKTRIGTREFVRSTRKSIRAGVSGILRGLMADGRVVTKGLKIGDVDPRGTRRHAFTMSDKARAVAGGVHEVITKWLNQQPRSR